MGQGSGLATEAVGTNAIIVNAHAKINWTLDILGPRADGYHEMDMLMQSVSLSNQLAFKPSDELTLSIDGVPADGEGLLVVKAARLLKSRCGYGGGVAISLKRHIPDRAGLGAGSSDCAAALKSLNLLWGLGLSAGELIELGASLGADVPFCLTGGLCRVGGNGDVLIPLSGHEAHIIIVMPDGGLSTAEVFKKYRQTGGEHPLSVDRAQNAICAQDYDALNLYSGNALYRAALSMSEAVREARDALFGAGAIYAQMSGSGSAVYGVFSDRGDCLRAQVEMRTRFPRAIATETIASAEA